MNLVALMSKTEHHPGAPITLLFRKLFQKDLNEAAPSAAHYIAEYLPSPEYREQLLFLYNNFTIAIPQLQLGNRLDQ